MLHAPDRSWIRRALAGLTFVVATTRLTAQAPPPVVSGPAADRALGWTLERAWSVGGADDETLALVQLWAKDLDTDSRGNLFVIDRTESQIVVYDGAGKRLRTIGRRGKGPGELSAALGIAIAPDGSVHVDDADKGVIVPFAADGKPQPEYRLARRVQGLRMVGTDRIAGTRVVRDTVRLVYGTRDSLSVLLSYRLAPTKSTPPVCRLTDYPAPPVFAATVTWAARGSQIAAATDGFRITQFDDGRPTRVLTRATPRRRSSAALARQHLGPGETMQILGMNPCTIPADLILSVAEVAPELPAYSALAIAPDGRIWATRYVVRGETGTADVYGANGYEGTVALGRVRPVAFLSTGELVSIERDADDVPVIAVYRVRRGR